MQTQLSRLLQAQVRDAEIAPEARADDRGGQGELHGAGVADFHDGAIIKRRIERGEERPVQPILSVHLDDLRKSPRESRYAGVTRGACVQHTSSLLIVRNLEKKCSSDHRSKTSYVTQLFGMIRGPCLLLGVRPLGDLDQGIQRPAISLEEHLAGLDTRFQWEPAPSQGFFLASQGISLRCAHCRF